MNGQGIDAADSDYALSQINEATQRVLLDRKVIMVNQGALDAHGRRVAKNGD